MPDKERNDYIQKLHKKVGNAKATQVYKASI